MNTEVCVLQMMPKNVGVIVLAYEVNFTLCVLLVYNDNGSVQTLCITHVIYKVFAQTHCRYKPTNNKQKVEIHFIYFHYFYVFGLL